MLRRALRFGVSLAAQRTDNGKRRNLLIHHGLMGSSRNFRTIAKHSVVASRCNTHLIDARNHGNSPHTGTHTIGELADDLLEYIQASGAGERLTLVGHSMGGLALMEFTKRHWAAEVQAAVDRVVIIDIPSDPVSNYPSYLNTGRMLRALAAIDLTQPLPVVHAAVDAVAISKEIGALLKMNLLQEESGLRWTVNLGLLAFEGYDNIGRYSLAEGHGRQWRKPVEYIYGGRSSYYDAAHHRRYCENYPQMGDDNFHGVKEAGHWVHADQPREFLSILERILQRDDPPS